MFGATCMYVVCMEKLIFTDSTITQLVINHHPTNYQPSPNLLSIITQLINHHPTRYQPSPNSLSTITQLIIHHPTVMPFFVTHANFDLMLIDLSKLKIQVT